MPDLSAVEEAMVAQVALSLFPDGTYQAGSLATSPVTNSQVKIYRGWPQASQLDIDLKANITHVSVFPTPGMARNTTRWLRQYQTINIPDATLTATVSGSSVLFGGTASAHQVVGVTYDGNGFTYRMSNTDTPTTVAAAMAPHFNGASASGATLTLSTNATISVTVMADANQILELRRQAQSFLIDIWAPDPFARDTFASVIDPWMADVRFLEFADGSVSDMPRYHGTFVTDRTEKEKLFRRNLTYSVEYPTVISSTAPRVMYTGGTISVNDQSVNRSTTLLP